MWIFLFQSMSSSLSPFTKRKKYPCIICNAVKDVTVLYERYSNVESGLHVTAL